VILRHPNRPNKRKQKKGSGCKLCKPWKGKWAHQFKLKERTKRKEGLDA
jgi:hypothetical protein